MDDFATEGSGSRGNTVDRLVEGLRDGIMNSRYPPGQRLIEADLTRVFGVSRGPVREAFRRLTAEGLLQILPNRGAVVRQLSREETLELFQVRSALESLAARLAAQTIDWGDNRQRFEAAIEQVWSQSRRPPGPHYHEENRLFHLAILDSCGNVQLAELGKQLRLPLLMLQLSVAMTAEMYEESVREHGEVADAILRGDSDAAEWTMRRHLERAYEVASNMPPSVFRN